MKTRSFVFFLIPIVLLSCSSGSKSSGVSVRRTNDNNAFLISVTSTDSSYGYAEKNPVKVGVTKYTEGPLNERRFLNALAGPNGENISYERRGSCCPFDSKNGFIGGGMLDIYEIKWAGQTSTIRLYINMYDADELKIPVGFTAKQ